MSCKIFRQGFLLVIFKFQSSSMSEPHPTPTPPSPPAPTSLREQVRTAWKPKDFLAPSPPCAPPTFIAPPTLCTPEWEIDAVSFIQRLLEAEIHLHWHTRLWEQEDTKEQQSTGWVCSGAQPLMRIHHLSCTHIFLFFLALMKIVYLTFNATTFVQIQLVSFSLGILFAFHCIILTRSWDERKWWYWWLSRRSTAVMCFTFTEAKNKQTRTDQRCRLYIFSLFTLCCLVVEKLHKWYHSHRE